MEASVSRNKRPKRKVDMISALPDSLLLHILSFLPAKEAVATSLLSKGWRSLWHSLSTLDLNREDFQTCTFFYKFVDKLLKLVDMRFVKKFVLQMIVHKPRDTGQLRPRKISDWINVVISNKVEHLELYFSPQNGGYKMPSSVFIANNIKVLKLTGKIVVGTLSHVDFPLLEVLHLNLVSFLDIRSLEKLLSASALLKDFVLKNWFDDLDRPLYVGVLNHLVTAEVPRFPFPLKTFSNVTFLRLDMPDQKPMSSYIPTFYKLTYLEFQYYTHNWKKTLKYLQSCPKLEILVIKSRHESKVPVTHKFGCSKRLQPAINVPRCVSSNLKEFHLDNYQGRNGEFKLARFIMKEARALRMISISRPTSPTFSELTWNHNNLKRITLCPISSVNCKLVLK